MIVDKYSYEEYENNMSLYSTIINSISILLAVFLASYIFSLMLHKVQFIFLFLAFFLFMLLTMVLEEKNRIEREYLRYAETYWAESGRTEIYPRWSCSVETDLFRCDVIVKNKIVEYYVPIKGEKFKRNTVPLNSVLFAERMDDCSFFVVEYRSFVDERFELLSKKVGVPFTRSRFVIQSNFILW